MAGGADVNRGPHTGSGTEAASTDLNGPQRKSLLSNFDFTEIAKLQLPSASGISNYAIFDKDDALAVAGSLPSFTKSFDTQVVRNLIDIFTAATAPAVDQDTLRNLTKEITINNTKYTISGPRGAQHPIEIATLHPETPDTQNTVLFIAPTATLLIIIQTAQDANVQHQSDQKQGVWAATRSFAFALSEKGL